MFTNTEVHKKEKTLIYQTSHVISLLLFLAMKNPT
jgi:hypothetical protein